MYNLWHRIRFAHQTMSVGVDAVAQASIVAIISRHVEPTSVDESAWRVTGCKVNIIDVVKRYGGH